MRARVLATAVGLFVLLPAGGARPPGHYGDRVDIAEFKFSPSEASVVVGDTVNWVWRGPDTDHSVTADPGQAEQFDSDPAGPPAPGAHQVGEIFSHTFRSTGRFTYHCRTHPSMRGTVTVGEGPDTTAPAIGSMRVRPTTFCTGRGCRRPWLEIEVTESAALHAQVQRRDGRRWRRARDYPLIFLRPGRNRKRLSVAGLRPGRYRLLARASDNSGNDSRTHATAFAVRRSG